MAKLSIPEEVKIKCCYCFIKDTCVRRCEKELYEIKGWMTKCILTPNRPGKKRKVKI